MGVSVTSRTGTQLFAPPAPSARPRVQRGPNGEVLIKTFIQPGQPNFNGPFIWIQTGLGDDGQGVALHFEDGQ